MFGSRYDASGHVIGPQFTRGAMKIDLSSAVLVTHVVVTQTDPCAPGTPDA